MVLRFILQDEFSRRLLHSGKELLTLPCSLKRNMALLGSNHARNSAVAQDAKCWAERSAHFHCGLMPNAKKNPLMRRSRLLRLMPLWLLMFRLRSVKMPSSLLLVLGIPSTSSQVNRYGR